jgi:hypothetical protein
MNQHAVLFAAAIAAATAVGCGKPSDLRPMQEETNSLVKSYEEKVTTIERRAQDLIQRGNKLALGSDAAPASGQLADVVRELLPTMQREVKEGPARIERIVKDDKLDEERKLAGLRAYQAEADERLRESWIRANAKLDAVEAWLGRAEVQPRAQRPAPAAPPPAPEPAPATAPEAAAGSAGPG